MQEIKLRMAQLEDAKLLFSWANDREVRANSFNVESIVYSDHLGWLKRKLASPSTHLFIGTIADKPVGQVRFDEVSPGECEIDIHVAPNVKGLGYGKKLLNCAVSELNSGFNSKKVNTVVAVVFESNLASYKLFLSCGFKEVKRKNINDIPCIELRLYYA
ncbi:MULTISPECIES: GNAT family N-acetyltransferase [Pseudoalteromonas]|uniref:GNAT family N-acetyltransferase n=1 Tax=Pseudoalteromonas TaxID=53246 RepID=UPI001582128B|nr:MULTISPECIES: GNAT family N-acetyltransferase [Pseudoalteromonas]MDI4652862.1 GNAT family N-acetyltransferase [Pseudoalteromonas shioyasakiensis]NUJ39650.1 GNAT family N-acetyltransferase [Pseudoalteromonas sp. 0303]